MGRNGARFCEVYFDYPNYVGGFVLEHAKNEAKKPVKRGPFLNAIYSNTSPKKFFKISESIV